MKKLYSAIFMIFLIIASATISYNLGIFKVQGNSLLNVKIYPRDVKLYVGQVQTFQVGIYNGTPPFAVKWYANNTYVGQGSTFDYSFKTSCSYVTFNVMVMDSFGNIGVDSTLVYDPLSFSTVVQEGSMVKDATWILFRNGGLTYVLNGFTGAIDYSSASFFSVSQYINSHTSNLTGGKVLFRNGVYYMDQPILWTAWGLDFEGETLAPKGNNIQHSEAIIRAVTGFSGDMWTFVGTDAPDIGGSDKLNTFAITKMDFQAQNQTHGHIITNTVSGAICRIIDNSFGDAKDAALKMFDTGNSWISNNIIAGCFGIVFDSDCSSNWCDHNYFVNPPSGKGCIIFNGSMGCGLNHIVENKFYTNIGVKTATAIIITGGISSHDFCINSNEFDGWATCVDEGSNNAVVFVGNMCYTNTAWVANAGPGAVTEHNTGP